MSLLSAYNTAVPRRTLEPEDPAERALRAVGLYPDHRPEEAARCLAGPGYTFIRHSGGAWQPAALQARPADTRHP